MSEIFDIIWSIFCFFWAMKLFKALKKDKPKVKKKNTFLEKAATSLIGKEIFEEIRKEIKKKQPGKNKILNLKPLQYQKKKEVVVEPTIIKKEKNEEINENTSSERQNKQTAIPLDKLRNGIIMAEILGPPRAKRKFGRI